MYTDSTLFIFCVTQDINFSCRKLSEGRNPCHSFEDAVFLCGTAPVPHEDLRYQEWSAEKNIGLDEVQTQISGLEWVLEMFFKALCVLYGRCNSTNVHLNSEFLFICCVLLTTIKSFGKKEVSFFVEEQLSLSTDQCSFWWEEDCCLFWGLQGSFQIFTAGSFIIRFLDSFQWKLCPFLITS